MRRLLLCALAATVAGALAVPVGAGAQTTSTQQANLQSATGEYVVLYKSTAAAGAAKAAIKAAGGTVLHENSAIGMATVRSDRADFIAAVSGKAGVAGAARNRAIGAVPHLSRKSLDVEKEARGQAKGKLVKDAAAVKDAEPLAHLQWGMRMVNATTSGSYRIDKGSHRVLVGVMDTGIDGSHPDLARNFNRRLSRNFTTDIPLIDGPCEDEPDHSCNDPADVDEDGHGTHVAGIIGAAINGLGVSGVAPDVGLVNIRAGQDSGFFFLDATINAMVYAGQVGIDVVNMSFFTDPWLFNCAANPADSPQEQIEQRTIIAATQLAVDFARARGVTFVAAYGNEHIDLGKPTTDTTSPDFPPGTAKTRTVDNSCIDVPTETNGVISTTALGPSGRKADYSTYGIEGADVSAPGGWFRDFFGSPQFRVVENEILSTAPKDVVAPFLDPNGVPTIPDVVRDCKGSVCAYYQYLQGTSMASPHAAGVAALVVSAHGHRDTRHGGLTLNPATTERILEATAEDTPCPTPPLQTYTSEGRDPSFNALCEGTLEHNGFYGFGVVDALAAVL
ncbi:MAG TPA: S8 family serine peptidase [Actinomycetes bacterium]